MRASHPAVLNTGVTEQTLAVVAEYLDAVAAVLRRPIASALEVGCGIGRVTPTIAGKASTVTALDPTAEMLHAARQACAGLDNVEFTRCAAQDLPLGPTDHDVAVSVWVLMHILDEEQLRAACHAIARSSRHVVLVEYEDAWIPVGPYSRLRPLREYLRLLPGARLLHHRELYYGGDRSFAALAPEASEGSQARYARLTQLLEERTPGSPDCRPGPQVLGHAPFNAGRASAPRSGSRRRCSAGPRRS